MSSVTLTAAMRANLLSLQGTAALLGQTQLRLSTGNKVNSALDNPVNFFAAQSLNNRASDLGALLDGMGQGIQVLKAADQGITSLTKLVNQLKSIGNSALGAVSTTTDSGTTGAGADLDSALLLELTDTAGNNTTASTPATDGDTFTLQAGSGAVHTFTISDGMTAQDLVDAINQVSNFHAELVDGSAVGLKALQISTTNGTALTVADGTGTAATDLGIDGAFAATTPAPDLSSQQTQYTDVIAQINQLITDTGYQGTNLLNGDDLTVKFNEKNTSSITVSGVTLDQAGLSLDANAGSWSDATTINASITKIDDALTQLRTQSGSYANALSIMQTRQDFTQNLINTLKDGATALTIADKNEEGASMLALQTAQQLGIQALSLSSQANQSVLRLFA